MNGFYAGNERSDRHQTAVNNARRKSRKPPKREHRLIAFKAFLDTDREIVNWWEGMEDGARSDVIRALLQSYIEGLPLYEAAQRKLIPVDGNTVQAKYMTIRLDPRGPERNAGLSRTAAGAFGSDAIARSGEPSQCSRWKVVYSRPKHRLAAWPKWRKQIGEMKALYYITDRVHREAALRGGAFAVVIAGLWMRRRSLSLGEAS